MKTSRTFAEYLFERYCDEHGIACARIPETTTKTPDYELFPTSSPVVVEIKDIEPNAEEIESERLLNERGWGNATGGTPGGRVRLKDRRCVTADQSSGAGAPTKHPCRL
jgi:hypothetical protein